MSKKKKDYIDFDADLARLEEMANGKFKNEEEAKTFCMGMVLTGLYYWMKEELDEEEETILTDTLASIMYVQL